MQVEKGTQDFLKDTIAKYYATASDKIDTVTVAWDGIMSKAKLSNLHCCGVENYRDFSENKNWTTMVGKMVPDACCIKENDVLKDSTCPINPTSFNTYQTGCYKAIMTAIEENAAIVIGVAATLVFVEVLVIILALYLACCYWRPQHGRLGVKVIY
ncbi:Tetraspanin-7 [Trachymyrmex septentrionalis]|uniref:Tetraspanin-7 n=1 Tax=Trachymyrmex septentrionalis TaxID=34720 RepID=A0A195FX01_9HYME|nr:Tetraspanin-7 [Trachymyrmex septentrionalis]